MDDIRTHQVERRSEDAAFTRRYIEAVRLTERLHRQFLELVKTELDRARIDDINNVQALILFSIGQDEMSVGELVNRGYYLGSNVSYNVKQLTTAGYIDRRQSRNDRRSAHVRLTEKGQGIRDLLVAMFARHAAALPGAGLAHGAIDDFHSAGLLLERFWLTGARP